MMNASILLLSLFLFIGIFEVNGFENRRKSMTEVRVMKADEYEDPHIDQDSMSVVPHLRQKRGLVSIFRTVGKGIKDTVRHLPKLGKRVISSEKTDLILNIAQWTHSIGNGLTDGCMSYPDICTGLKELQKLEKENDKLFTELKSWETDDNDKFETLRVIYHRNRHLKKEIDELCKDFEDIAKYHNGSVDDQFNTSVNRSFSEELNNRLSELEYELNNLQTFIGNNRLNTLVYTGIDMMIEYLVFRITKSLSKNYDHEWQKFIDQVHYDQSQTLNDKDLDKLRRRKIDKTLRKTYNIKFSRFTHSLRVMGVSLKGFGKAIVHFPRKVKNALTNPKQTLEKIRYRLKAKTLPFRNRKTFLKTVKIALNNKVSKIKLAFGGLSKSWSAFDMYLTQKEYKKLNDDVKKKVEEYKALNKELKNTIQNAEKNFSLSMESAVEDFVQLAENFTSFVNSKHLNIAGSLILKSLPVNISHQLLQNYSNVNSRNIEHEQRNLLRLLRDPRYNMKTLKHWLEARHIMRTEMSKMLSKNLPFQNVYFSLPKFYRYLEGVKKFGDNLTLVDMLCEMAMLETDRDIYDHFNITSLREECTTNMSTLSIGEVLSDRREILIRSKIKLFVSDEEFTDDLSKIIDIIYTNLRMDTYMIPPYDSKPTKQDLLCQIAAMYPRRRMFDFYDLRRIRLWCQTNVTMTETVFEHFDEQANQKRIANILSNFKKEMAAFSHKNVTEVKDSNHSVDSSLSQSSSLVKQKQILDKQKTKKRDDVKLAAVDQKPPVKNSLLNNYTTTGNFVNPFTDTVRYEITSIQNLRQNGRANSKNITVIISEDISSNSGMNKGNRTGHSEYNAGHWAFLLAMVSLFLPW